MRHLKSEATARVTSLVKEFGAQQQEQQEQQEQKEQQDKA
jgi:hypothetical protein